MELTVTPWKKTSGSCDCCGRASKTVWGDVAAIGRTYTGATKLIIEAIGSEDDESGGLVGRSGNGLQLVQPAQQIAAGDVRNART